MAKKGSGIHPSKVHQLKNIWINMVPRIDTEEEGAEVEEEGEEEEEEEIDGNSLDEKDSSDEVSSVSQAPSDIARLTSRQRTLLRVDYDDKEDVLASGTTDSSATPSLEALSSIREPATLTEEELLKKSEKSRRRKHQRDQKLEKSKTETIQRLLQRQSSRSKRMSPLAGKREISLLSSPPMRPFRTLLPPLPPLPPPLAID